MMNLPSCSDTIVPQDLPARLSEVLQPAIDASLPYGRGEKGLSGAFREEISVSVVGGQWGQRFPSGGKGWLAEVLIPEIVETTWVRSSDHGT